MLKSTQPGKMRDSCQNIINNEDEELLSIIEGYAGSTFIFDNNLVHKGTLPVSGERIHISMEIMPSKKDFSLKEFREICQRQPKDYYNPRPFLNNN